MTIDPLVAGLRARERPAVSDRRIRVQGSCPDGQVFNAWMNTLRAKDGIGCPADLIHSGDTEQATHVRDRIGNMKRPDLSSYRNRVALMAVGALLLVGLFWKKKLGSTVARWQQHQLGLRMPCR
ncbi:MAG: hypothetical protein IPG11_12985 [Flavobacteriales bacterium]|nr:hypothetical protein [Flavobacteriales bacterium]